MNSHCAARDEGRGEPEKLSRYRRCWSNSIVDKLFTSREEVIVYNKGEKVKLKPYSGMLNVDFGEGINKSDVYLLHLPEVRSAHEVLGVGVPTVSARLGTAPFWNWGMPRLNKLNWFRDINFSRTTLEHLADSF